MGGIDNTDDIEKRKCLAFDMDTKALQTHYKNGNWHTAYNDIGAFLAQKDFTHEQGSVYDSKYAMDEKKLALIVNDLCDAFKWFAPCVKSIRGYDLPEVVDFTLQVKERNIANDIQTQIQITKTTTKSNIINKRKK